MNTDEKTGIDWPLFQSQVEDTFGAPDEPPFPEDYLVTMDFTEFAKQFAHVKDCAGKPWSCRIYGNYVLEDPLRMAFRSLVDRGLAQELRTFDGCFNIRKMSGGSGYSMHSWGLAVDFNAGRNAYGCRPTFSDAFVICFAQAGFEWGGLWTASAELLKRNPYAGKDGMHFQIVWIKERTGPLAPIPWSGS